jgi:hypothetical protein
MHLRNSLFAGRWALRCLVVPGHPFTARYLVVFVAGGKRQESRGQIWRDSQGRLRQELEIAGVAAGAFISDPATRTVIALSHPNREYLMSRPDSRYGGFAPRARQLRVLQEIHEGERRVINGLECVRRDQITRGIEIQTWISPTLAFAIREQATEPDSQATCDVYDVVLDEPDATLFEVPSGYRPTAQSD